MWRGKRERERGAVTVISFPHPTSRKPFQLSPSHPPSTQRNRNAIQQGFISICYFYSYQNNIIRVRVRVYCSVSLHLCVCVCVCVPASSIQFNSRICQKHVRSAIHRIHTDVWAFAFSVQIYCHGIKMFSYMKSPTFHFYIPYKNNIWHSSARQYTASPTRSDAKGAEHWTIARRQPSRAIKNGN